MRRFRIFAVLGVVASLVGCAPGFVGGPVYGGGYGYSAPRHFAPSPRFYGPPPRYFGPPPRFYGGGHGGFRGGFHGQYGGGGRHWRRH